MDAFASSTILPGSYPGPSPYLRALRVSSSASSGYHYYSISTLMHLLVQKCCCR